ncbi:MAG: TonB-dependent receptor, partial [Chromatiaceae bacterium]
FTWIPTAEFRSGIPDKGVDAGNRLSYSPEWMGNLALTYHTGPLEAALLVNYTGEVYGEARNRKEIDPENHRDGLLPSYHTVDLTGQYAVNQQFSVFGAIKNLTDERYISGLRQGIYVGPERSFELGAKYSF